MRRAARRLLVCQFPCASATIAMLFSPKEGDMADDNGGDFMWFLAGLGVGALLGVMYAPRPGSETRETIREKAGEGREFVKSRARQAREQASEWAERGRDIVSQQRDQIRNAVDAGRQAYREATDTGAGPKA
jgi:gas vesicle protein